MKNEKGTLPRIGFIGLGVMGEPMAANLLEAGYSLTVFNRSVKAAARLEELGAHVVNTVAKVAESSDVVVTMLPDTPDVEAVYFTDDGLLASSRPGMLLIDTTTASPSIARRIAQTARERGIETLDAPVSGGDVGAKAGTLSIMVGGEEAVFVRALPIFEAMGRNIVYMGPAGAGQVTKACNQIVVALTIEAVGEAFALAEKSGVELDRVRDALLGGFAQSRILDLHGQRALEQRYNPGFRLKLHHKDLGIALSSAAELGVSLPHTAGTREMMNVLLAHGHDNEDHSYLIQYLRNLAQADSVI
ncbi:MAG: 2-hydroxy-3-oxopropionate reductase [Sulfobacillus thermosulfidooxidans]|uniref:2-hydroxy-3-oxopropionate reductase n=1 Tax=Sulfobacillus TaxID=28033 RepID=UPI000CD327C4|nr:2-hydroxy-3-oxopropionate reductase [Sulfobacillus sp. hq2]POB10656.1 2-hydroxy-3-oxopropionate reductase [Sulfobacillus sp. hq2]PSR37700.1 MAG: 2-hydroxy-3-oxopropionate reductase [Sulfobacillus thermosulfidooxidans]